MPILHQDPDPAPQHKPEIRFYSAIVIFLMRFVQNPCFCSQTPTKQKKIRDKPSLVDPAGGDIFRQKSEPVFYPCSLVFFLQINKSHIG